MPVAGASFLAVVQCIHVLGDLQGGAGLTLAPAESLSLPPLCHVDWVVQLGQNGLRYNRAVARKYSQNSCVSSGRIFKSKRVPPLLGGLTI